MSKKELELRLAEMRKRNQREHSKGEDRCAHRNPDVFLEEHYSPTELAQKWKKHPSTIRRWFQDEPDVIREGGEESRNTRQYYTYSIPKSVAGKVHAQKM